MNAINDLTINISLQTKAATVQNFGTALVFGKRSSGPLIDHFGEYSELAQLVDAGFTAEDPEFKVLAHFFSQSPRLKSVGVIVRDSADSLATYLPSILSTKEHYAILTTDRETADLHSFGDAVLTHERLFIGGADSISVLTERNNIREAYLIHNEAAKYPEAAWAGLCLPFDIGQITWKWKCPSGVSASNFSLAELQAIREAKGQTFSKRNGYIYSDEGITTGGEFIDVIMSRDYVKARLGEDLFLMQMKNGKIPFDDSGAAIIESIIRARFKQCGQQGIIARAVSEEDFKKSDEGEYMYSVNVPSRSEVPENDRAARNWKGIEFAFTIAGAVHAIEITGTIGV